MGADFNPRTPCGVRRPGHMDGLSRERISIHAPRVGCDLLGSSDLCWWMNFNPRTPCGVRPIPASASSAASQFQSTHPVWGATVHECALAPGWVISIHAPRVGCDNGFSGSSTRRIKFQSTHPVWGATVFLQHNQSGPHNFNPRTPCGVRPCSRSARTDLTRNFNPRTPCGVRPAVQSQA